MARFEFHVTNTSQRPVKVYQIRASCGCTTWEAPRMPWILAPGERGTVKAAVDFRGKEGEIAKDLLVGTIEGTQTLMMVIQVPLMSPAMRAQNQALAAANRQAVFQGDCAVCHAKPAESQFGIELFEAVCAVCQKLAAHGVRVILAGLDQDFRGEPFGPMPQLMALAEDVTKLHAICAVCGEEASRTQRLIDNQPATFDQPIVVVGASEMYEARCREHHLVPGRPTRA